MKYLVNNCLDRNVPRDQQIGRVRKLTITADDAIDQVTLGALERALVHLEGREPDDTFDTWLAGKIAEYLGKHKLKIVNPRKPKKTA